MVLTIFSRANLVRPPYPIEIGMIILAALPYLWILLYFQADNPSHLASISNHRLQCLFVGHLPNNLALVAERLHLLSLSRFSIRGWSAHTKDSIGTFCIYWPGDWICFFESASIVHWTPFSILVERCAPLMMHQLPVVWSLSKHA